MQQTERPGLRATDAILAPCLAAPALEATRQMRRSRFFEQTIRLAPRDPYVVYRIGLVHLLQSRTDEAII
jgi:hypothetical protein